MIYKRRFKKINEDNLILKSDSYKYSHFMFLPQNADYAMSYIESRGGKYDYTLFFGLQYYVLRFLMKPITMEDIDEAEQIITAHGLPFYREGWERILKVYNGFLPVKIRAVPEGTIVKNKNVLMTIESAVKDPKVVWVVSWLETLILKVWNTTTISTGSNSIRNVILDALEKTSNDPMSEIDFKLHDFGYRGVSSEESAGLGGMAHLVNFNGTDTIAGLVFARNYYDMDMAGYSIIATEHSVMTQDGEKGEAGVIQRIIEKTKGVPLVAMVLDAYNIDKACREIIGGKLKPMIIEGKTTFVIRPDSGTPWKVVPRVMKILDEQFGSTLNDKGYKVLNNVRMIQGDGIDEDSIKKIYEAIFKLGYSATNIAFGMGGALLQKVDRDTQKFAMKACALEVGGVLRELAKNPIDDPGKQSKQGLLELIEVDGEFTTVRRDQITNPNVKKVLEDVYDNGKLLRFQPFENVRERARKVA